MSIAVWPPSLPQTVLVGYTESVGVNVVRTPMDSGPAKIRFKGKKPKILTASIIMNASQVAILENFIINTVRGSLRFTFPHPRLGSTQCRFVTDSDGQAYSLEHYGLDYYKVGIKLEVVL